MSRLTSTFATLNEKREKALVCFVTAGDPFPDQTAYLIKTIADAGADIIELGVPFSDPLADGPTIQASTQRALDAGMTPPKVLEIVRQTRQMGVTVPIVLMGAWNPVLQYGIARFARDANQAGVDGTIITDLTPEEADDWIATSRTADLDTIFLLAPTSTPSRRQAVGKLASGFVYCVSRMGVTGARDTMNVELPDLIKGIKEYTDLPVCVGFGITTPQHVANICRDADGAVVGSALVDLLHRTRTDTSLGEVTTYIRDLKAATRLDYPASA